MKTDGQLESLERMVQDVEFAQIEIKVIDGLKIGNDALKKLHDLLSIEEIERIMEESQEGVDKQREIDAVLSGVLTEEDEGEVEAELEALISQDVEPAMPEVPKDILLPDLPEDKLVEDKSIKFYFIINFTIMNEISLNHTFIFRIK